MRISNPGLLALSALFAAVCLPSCDDDDETDPGPGEGQPTQVGETQLSASSRTGDLPYDEVTLSVTYDQPIALVADAASKVQLSAPGEVTAFELEKSPLPKKFTLTAKRTAPNVAYTLTIPQGVVTTADGSTALEARTYSLGTTPNWPVAEASVDDAVMHGVQGLGWDLGNQFDAHVDGVSGETAWGQPKATQATFDKVKAAGFTAVRIPVTWMGHVGKAPGYVIEKAWMDRVAEVVGYAVNAGFQKIIVNIHHDGADSQYWLNIVKAVALPSENDKVKAQLTAMWKQIATRLQGLGGALIYETMNEIHDGKWGWGGNRSDGGKSYGILNEWQQVCVDAIRSVDTDHWIGVVGYCQNPDLTMANLVMPQDPQKKLMVSVHYYDPNAFTLDAKQDKWGHTGGTDAGKEEACTTMFKRLNQKYVSQGIPCYIGESGCVHRGGAAEPFRRYWMKYVMRAALEYGLQPYIWDNGATGSGSEQHSLFNHGTGEYQNADARQCIEETVAAFKKEVTLQSIYDGAPK